jgi:hypothetical protein
MSSRKLHGCEMVTINIVNQYNLKRHQPRANSKKKKKKDLKVLKKYTCICNQVLELQALIFLARIIEWNGDSTAWHMTLDGCIGELAYAYTWC